MAWTAADLAQVDEAIAFAYASVTKADGAGFTAQEIADLKERRRIIATALDAAAGTTPAPRYHRAYYTKGLQ